MAVRRESVVLDLDDRLTPGLIRAAAATGLLNRELKGLGGNTGSASKGISKTETEAGKLNKTLGGSTREIDRFSGRLQLLTTAALAVGPALVPIGAVGVEAVAGLSAEFGSAVIAAGAAVLAFHGVGGALTALNKAALDPTVTNLKAAQLALDGLPPAARAFTQELSAMTPQLDKARQAAASGLFPGLEDGLHEIQGLLPQVDRILFRVSSTLGSLASEGAKSFAGPEWSDFRNFIEREAPVALTALGHSLGNVVHGLAGLVLATAPLSNNFSDGLVKASAAFDQWATSVGKTQGFEDFLAFVEQAGPEVGTALAAIAHALEGIVQAAAPLSGPVLAALTAISNVIATIGKSDLGTPIYATITALLLLGRAQSAFGKISETSWATAYRGASTYQEKVSALRGPLIKGGLAAAGLAVAGSGVADKFGLANTATLALTGSLAGPWGAAAGAAVGLALDLSKSSQGYQVNAAQLTDTLNQQTGAITANTRAYVAQQLQQQGVLDAAQKTGVSLSDVTSAALGNSAAQARVNAEMDAFQATLAGNVPKLADFAGNATTVLDAVETTSGAVQDATGNVGQLGAAVAITGGKFNTAKTAAELFRQELDHVNDTLAHRAGLRDYQAALDAFTASVKQNGRSLDITTEKGRNNQAALDAIAQSALAVAQTMKGSNQTHFLTQARQDFLDAAHKLGLGSAQAQALADKLGLLNRTEAKPKIYIDGISPALAQLEAVAAHLAALRSKTITLTTLTTTGGHVKGGADGMTVPGPRYPYGDKVLAHLAPGEEVITNRHGEADAFRRDRASGRIPRYASGGTVGGSGGGKPGDAEMRGLQHAIDLLTKTITADTKSRDATRQAAQALSQSVAGAFQTDIFAASGIWSGGGSPNAALRGDIRNEHAFGRALHRAAKKGLHGGAFAALAASGNLQAAQFEAHQSRGDLALTDRLFNRRRRAGRENGQLAATERYGARLASIEKALHAEHAELVKLNQQMVHRRKEAKQHAKDAGHEFGKTMNKQTGDGVRKVRH